MQFGPLNQSIQGWLSLLRLKNGGNNVQTVDSNLYPHMDYLPWLLGRPTVETVLYTSAAVASNGLAIGGSPVPEGKLRLFTNISYNGVIAAATTIELIPTVSINSSNSIYCAIADEYTVSGPNNAFAARVPCDQFTPFFAWPAFRFGALVRNFTGAPTFEVHARYIELDL